MFSRNLSVLDFVRRFFVSCAQISEALALRPPLKFECDWRKIGHKSKCRKIPREHLVLIDTALKSCDKAIFYVLVKFIYWYK